MMLVAGVIVLALKIENFDILQVSLRVFDSDEGRGGLPEDTAEFLIYFYKLSSKRRTFS
jgi:hypothetical protein